MAEQRVRETVRVRRSPRYSTFLLLGAGLGLLAALVLTFAVGRADDQSPTTGFVYSAGQIFGFLALAGIAVGVALGGAVALVLDRVVSRRAREFAAEHERFGPEG